MTNMMIIKHFPLSISGSTNLVGKFTQSVRRIVQDVKDEGTASMCRLIILFEIL